MPSDVQISDGVGPSYIAEMSYVLRRFEAKTGLKMAFLGMKSQALRENTFGKG